MGVWSALAVATMLALAGPACENDADTKFYEWKTPTPGDDDADDDAPAEDVPRDAKIIVDDLGVPHIYAQNDRDLFFAAGYWQATDRLFQIDIARRKATGRMAEVFGPDGLDADRTALTFRFPDVGARSLDLMRGSRPDDFELFKAFVDGMNARVARVLAGDAPLPWGFGPGENDYAPEPFTYDDVMAMGIRIVFGFSATIEYDLLNTILQRTVADYAALPITRPGGRTYFMADALGGEIAATGNTAPPASPEIRQQPQLPLADGLAVTRALARLRDHLDLGEGSNNWVVRGDLTDSGAPILVNDSHAGYEIPSRMMLMHLDSSAGGGKFNVIGFAFPGIPGIHVGTTRRLSWGATTAFADATDLWDVSVNAKGAHLGGKTYPVWSRTQNIRVRGEDGTLTDVPFTNQWVEGFGVLVPDGVLPVPNALFAKGSVLVNWPGFGGTDELYFYFDLDRATSLDDFEDAIVLQRVGMQNWVAASADGIRLMTHGDVPDRGIAEDRPRANALLDGDDPDTLWTGAFLDPQRLPYLDDTQPFIVTANNDPWGFTDDNDPLNDPFYYGSWFSPGFRARRLTARLGELIAEGPVDWDAMAALDMDNFSAVRERLVPVLVAAMNTVGLDPDLDEYENRDDLFSARDALVAWDGHVTRDSEIAALARVWLAYVERRLLADDLSLLFEELDAAQPVTMVKLAILIAEGDIDALTENRLARDLIAALDDALDTLAERALAAGVDALTWADIHAAYMDSPDGAQVKLVDKDGDDTSPNVSQSECWSGGQLRAECLSTDGAVYRFVTTFDENGHARFRFNVPFGSASPTHDWVEGEFPEVPLRRADVEARAIAVTTLALP